MAMSRCGGLTAGLSNESSIPWAEGLAANTEHSKRRLRFYIKILIFCPILTGIVIALFAGVLAKCH